jgi:hypothetical protein
VNWLDAGITVSRENKNDPISIEAGAML